MKLKQLIHRSIDDLDNAALTVLYEHIQMLQEAKHSQDKPSRSPSIEKILELTSSSSGSWSDGVIADRSERL